MQPFLSSFSLLLCFLISLVQSQTITCKTTIDDTIARVYLNNVDITNTVSGTLNSWSAVKTFSFTAPTVDVILAVCGNDVNSASSSSASGFSLECTGAPHWNNVYTATNNGWKVIPSTTSTTDSFPANWYLLSFSDTAYASPVTSTSGYSMSGSTTAQKIWSSSTQKYMGFRIRVNVPTNSPTREPTKQPTPLPTKQPTVLPTLSPTRRPTLLPTFPTTLFPTFEPSESPTRLPTTAKPSRTPSLSPTGTLGPTPPTPPTTYTPSTPQPTRSPTKSLPTVSPTNVLPTLSPTNQPQMIGLCTSVSSDLESFVNYDNFFNFQASSCAAECKPALLGQVEVNVRVCTENCRVFQDKYTDVCLDCFQNFLQCQSSNCTVCFASGNPYLARECKSCATQYCREPLRICTGFPLSVLNIATPAPVDPQAEQQQQQQITNIGAIAGGSVAGALVLLGLVVIIRRRSLNRQAEKEVERVAARIIKNKDGGGGMAMMSARVGDSVSDNPSFQEPPASPSSGGGAAVALRVPLRTRFSFHGEAIDELDVPAGATLLGLSRNKDWWVALDETTGRAGVIPVSYVTEMG